MSLRKGDQWETRACQMLRSNGLKIRHRNYRTRHGEIDIIAEDAGTLVFVEVRYRRDTGFGRAAATVTRSKQRRIIATARAFIAATPRWANNNIRFDVIGFDRKNRGEVRCDWLRSAFEVS